MVVGDDAQSIYGFRGASHQNIMAFQGRLNIPSTPKLKIR
jgi:superfamily I DNA/RNA helicase